VTPIKQHWIICAILLVNIGASPCVAQTCEDLPEHRKLLEQGKDLSRKSGAPARSSGWRGRGRETLPPERFNLYPGNLQSQPLLPVNEIDTLPLSTASQIYEAVQYALNYSASGECASAEKLFRRILNQPQIEKQPEYKARICEWLVHSQMEHAAIDTDISANRSAMALLQEAIKLRLALNAADNSNSKGKHSEAHLSLCKDYRNLAKLQELQGDTERAYSSLRKALTACGSYQLCKAEVADTLIELSVRNRRLNELHEVESILTDRAFRQNYTRTGNVNVYEHLASAYLSFGQHTDAQRVMTLLFDSDVALRLTPLVVSSLLPKAPDSFLTALAEQAIKGPCGAQNTSSLLEIANILVSSNKLGQAESIYSKCYSCCTDPSRDLQSAVMFAHFLERKGEYDKSAEVYSKLIAKIDGQKYEISKDVTDKVITAMSLSRPDAARTYKLLIEKAQSILTWQQDRARRFECLKTADELDQTASRLLSQSELEMAEKLYKRSLEIKIKNLDPDDPEIATAYFQLARVADEKMQFDIAIADYEQALSIYRKNPKGDPRQQALVLENFAGMLDRLNRRTEAENVYAQARAAYALATGH
jgi:tetratricopeptide (TPR) repeat protein